MSEQPQPESEAPFDQTASVRRGRIVLAVGALVFLTVQLHMVALPLSLRHEPVEVDDVYGYILKAEQLRSDPLQRSPALTDLRQQFNAPSDDPRIAHLRFLHELRTLLVYHPAHSLIVLGFRQLFDWSRAYMATALLGSLILLGGVCCWLWVLWGREVAGVSLLLLAPVTFASHGIHSPVPTTLCLGFALLTWVAVSIDGRHRGPTLILGTVLMLGTHPLGKVYALLCLAWFLLQHRRAPTRREWMWGGGVLTLVAVTTAVSYLIPQPLLWPGTDPPPPGATPAATIAANFRVALHAVHVPFQRVAIPSLLLIGYGFLKVPRERRYPILLATALLGVVAGASLLHPMPHYPGTMFRRVWIPLGLLLFGLMGQAAWSLVSILIARVEVSEAPQDGDRRRWVLPAIAGVCLVVLLVRGVPAKLELRARELQSVTHHHPYLLDRSQPARLLDLSRPGDSVLYQEKICLYFFLSYGALERGAVFYPVVRGTPEAEPWVARNESLRFLVAPNPLHRLPNARPEGLLLAPGSRLALEVTSPARHISVRLQASTRARTEVSVRVGDEGERRLEVGVEPTWVVLPEARPGAVQLMLETVQGRAILGGVRLTEDQRTLWPWELEARVSLRTGEETARVRLTPAELCPGLGRAVTVFEDRGFTVLARLGAH